MFYVCLTFFTFSLDNRLQVWPYPRTTESIKIGLHLRNATNCHIKNIQLAELRLTLLPPSQLI